MMIVCLLVDLYYDDFVDNSYLIIDELTLLFGNEILNDENNTKCSYKFKNSFKTQVVSQ
jgi:hypothetical protein